KTTLSCRAAAKRGAYDLTFPLRKRGENQLYRWVMKATWTWRVCLVGIVAAAVVFVAVAGAATGSPANRPRVVAIAAVLGITPQQLVTDLRNGETLAQIANANGKKLPVKRLVLLHRLRLAVVRLAAGYLGLTPKQLRAELTGGQTLAALATGQGKTAAGLEASIEAAVQKRLDAAVTAGHLSSQNEAALMTALGKRLD